MMMYFQLCKSKAFVVYEFLAYYTSDGAVFNVPVPGTYSVVFADYNGEVQNDMDIVTVTVTEETIGEITKASEKGISIDTGDKVMLWEGTASLKPLCKNYEK